MPVTVVAAMREHGAMARRQSGESASGGEAAWRDSSLEDDDTELSGEH